MITSSIALFEQQSIRKTRHNEQRYFLLEDVVFVLTDSKDPKQYIKRMKSRDPELKKGWVQIVPTLGIETPWGIQKMSCANTAGILRIIQSIPSPKAEPFKLRLAQVGYERIQEINDPALAQERMKQLYEAKWYSKEWIDKRLRGISVRQTLTDERKDRWVKEGVEYAILTAEISKATFGMTPSEYLEHKGLHRQNLRDHMTDLELIFTMLGEASTTEIMQQKNSQWFIESTSASRAWWKIAGDARKKLEQQSGKKVISEENYLIESEKTKRITKK